MKFKYIITTLYLLSNITLYCQYSEKGEPLVFNSTYAEKLNPANIPLTIMPPVNLDSLLALDSLSQANGGPPIFGYGRELNIGLTNAGRWDTVENEMKIWRVRISCPSAFYISFIFDKFRLPEGAKLYLYNEDKSMVIGAFTKRNNKESGKFSTQPTRGNSVILEYSEPINAEFSGEIHISRIFHGFKDFFNLGISDMFLQESNKDRKSRISKVSTTDCLIDVNCPEGDDWCKEKHAISKILYTNNGVLQSLCSGGLLNNKVEDFKPYFLTAFHCIDGINNSTGNCELSNQEKDWVNTWIFYFKYWNTTCNSFTPSTPVVISGADFRAAHNVTDFALLELDNTEFLNFLDSEVGFYFLGWNRSTSTPQTVATLHHANGAPMKITAQTTGTISTTGKELACLGSSNTSDFWGFSYNIGGTEGGASGAPIMDQGHKVIGQVTSGECLVKDETRDGSGGKFYLSWNGGGTSTTRLKDWLDPNNTNVTTLDGIFTDIKLYNWTIDGNDYAGYLENDLYSNSYYIHTPTVLEVAGGKTFTPSKTIDNDPFLVVNPYTMPMNVDFKAGREIRIKACTKITALDGSGDFYFRAHIDDIVCEMEENVLEEPIRPIFASDEPPTGAGDCGGLIVRRKDDKDYARRAVLQEIPTMPTEAILWHYPNPLMQSAVIQYMIQDVGTVKLLVQNMYGQTVAELVNQPHHLTGIYKIDFDASKLPAGVYFYSLRTATYSETRQMVIVK